MNSVVGLSDPDNSSQIPQGFRWDTDGAVIEDTVKNLSFYPDLHWKHASTPHLLVKAQSISDTATSLIKAKR